MRHGKIDAQQQKAKFEKYVQVLCSTLESYERDHPQWRWESLLLLIDIGLQALRGCIEAKTPIVHWDNPILTWHFPVDWDWPAWRRRDKTGSGYRYERMTLGNTG